MLVVHPRDIFREEIRTARGRLPSIMDTNNTKEIMRKEGDPRSRLIMKTYNAPTCLPAVDLARSIRHMVDLDGAP